MHVGPNVYLRSDGRWEARYQKGVDEKGRTVYGYTYGKTQEEAVSKRTAKLEQLFPDGNSSILASQNPDVRTCPSNHLMKKRSSMKREKFIPPFSETEAEQIQSALIEQDQPESTAYLLGLFAGLSLGEIAALRYGDLNFTDHSIIITRSAKNSNRKLTSFPVERRVVPMTDYIFWILQRRGTDTKNRDHYIFTDSADEVESTRRIESRFRKLLNFSVDTKETSVEALRSTFVARCLESNLNIETVSELTGADMESIYRYFGRYIKATPSDIRRLDRYCRLDENENAKHLNLMILGAGSHGHGVMEIAKMTGVFGKIVFLDDNVAGTDILGKCTDYLSFQRDFPVAFPAFGDNELRAGWIERLQNAGFLIPRLVHPSAIVSDNVEIGEGSIIMAQATVNPDVKIGDGCILAPNSMVSFGSTIGRYSHLDSGCIVAKDVRVPEKTTIESGEVCKN